ncbi:Exopolysaccharide biosynthesis polyprenyl glycosylphosphotransferase [Desulfonema limicola]|uniref:Exopolysaccharide biosynthesis polyprenyl glycosylphosphotransferase n=1 Tax=Desulfonema limicola TaxID=45656 RepID=A0A975BD82_9BACT|nr:sugar transferase [Desulfonema limicola]QTA83326.1 Exopolysaccharide biosynthesis polyprenyl glycosylphosphotransferase [Desulfonema limicola]
MGNNDYKIKTAENLIKYFDIILFLFLFIFVGEYFVSGKLFNISGFISLQFSIWDISKFLILIFIWNRIFSFMRMYQFKITGDEKVYEYLIRIITACSIGTASICFTAYIMGNPHISITFYLIFWAEILTVFIIYRIAFFEIARILHIRRPRQLHAVIVGLNIRSIELADSLNKTGTGYKFIGFVDDMPEDENDEEIQKAIPMVCSLSEFEDYISNFPMDEVFLTLPLRSYYDEISRIIKICTTQGIKTRLVNDLFDFHLAVPQYVKDDLPEFFIDYDVLNRSALQHDLKRIFDILVSFTGLLVLTPVFAAVALAIAVQDGFPVIYIQKRIGLNKRRFDMFKFRSMVRNADQLQAELEALNEVQGAAFKITDDPRITKLGKFLRKSSLDEIPQFLNVLQGTMSIVGPRPLPIRDFERFYKDTHRRRFSVKPGITGLWQVSGRSETEFEEWMALDLQYIDNWNLWFDFKIFLKTIHVVLAGKGAK